MSSATAWMEYEDFNKTAPEAAAALRALAAAVEKSGLEKDLTELLKIRASQMNGCAFCTQFHLNTARKLQIPAEKLDLVAVWHDSPVFSARERAAMEWTEQLTEMPRGGATAAAYAALQEQFTTSEIAFLTAAIANINAWNRIAAGLRFTPPRRVP
jgi:AhpD family alkylhydroperoxidase